MFDWYIPNIPTKTFACKECGKLLQEYQGFHGSNALFVWKQGEEHPIDQRVGQEIKISEEDMTKFCLSESFEFSGYCINDHSATFIGKCVSGVWVTTERI
mgnify:FL=1